MLNADATAILLQLFMLSRRHMRSFEHILKRTAMEQKLLVPECHLGIGNVYLELCDIGSCRLCRIYHAPGLLHVAHVVNADLGDDDARRIRPDMNASERNVFHGGRLLSAGSGNVPKV